MPMDVRALRQFLLFPWKITQTNNEDDQILEITIGLMNNVYGL